MRNWMLLCWAVGLLAFSPMVSAAEKAEVKPIRALLVTGGCCHDYQSQKKILTEGISSRANVQWTIVHEGGSSLNHKVSIYGKPNWWEGYDVIVHDECFADMKDQAFAEGILEAHKQGVPAVNIHCAVHSYRVDMQKWTEWFKFVGLKSTGHGPQEPIEVNFTGDHPITKGMTTWTTIKEELYNNVEVMPGVNVLAKGKQQVTNKKTGESNTVEAIIALTTSYGPKNTRVFTTTLAHNNQTTNDPRFLDLVTRGLLWSVNKLGDDGKPLPGYEAAKQ